MGRLSCHVRRMRAGIALALLVAFVAAPAAALADRDHGKEGRGPGLTEDFTEHLDCPGRETLVRIDEKTCEATPNRPLIVRRRACCENPAGRVHCRHFQHCPSHSPS
jgi:hypothetical protein